MERDFTTGEMKFKMLILAVLLSFEARSQDSLSLGRLNTVIIGSSVLYAGSMIGLGTVWYQDFNRFHFFNDNDGWGYMDKLGHVTTAQHVGRGGIEVLKWTGLERKKAIWYGGMSGTFFLTTVEVFDGFSEGWGFSVGDVTSNVLGSTLLISQELLWDDQRILTKWSYSGSRYAQYRPELLGANAGERWLKDYNGQTYWLSMNLKSLFFTESTIPEWLNVAVGYGIDGYTGANRNPTENSAGETIPGFERYGQYYLSPDLDLSKIPVNSPFLKAVLKTLNFVKVPLPGVVYDEVKGLRYRWLLL